MAVLQPLPRSNRPLRHGEQRMGFGHPDTRPCLRDQWAAQFQFHAQMPPFMDQLALGDGDGLGVTPLRENFGPIEVIAPCVGLIGYSAKKRANRVPGRNMGAEPLELGMPEVAVGLACEHGLCQQGFTPTCQQCLPVEVPRMH